MLLKCIEDVSLSYQMSIIVGIRKILYLCALQANFQFAYYFKTESTHQTIVHRVSF